MISFTKMHGIGNDFVMIDALRDGAPGVDLSQLARDVNDRRFGVGGDGLILVEEGKTAPFRMRMFNPDGSEAEMCGNGIRCFAKLLVDHGHASGPRVDVETAGGLMRLEILEGGMVRVDVGQAALTRGDVGMIGPPDERLIEQPVGMGFSATAVRMGNPHLVIFVDDVEAVDLATIGPKLEHHDFFPHRINVHFAQVVDQSHIIQRTWERGAGITLACGTGACSVGVAGVETGRSNRDVEIKLPGGRLKIEYKEDGHVFMTGPAETVFVGRYER
jgi:diaminopimelate epimerase